MAAALAIVLALTAAGSAAPASGQSSVEVVATGLDNPRHVSFSATGALYVVEAGRGGAGPCVTAHPNPDLGVFCLGTSGAVTQVHDNGPEERVVTGLPSIISGSGETLGPSDIKFTGSQKFVLSIGIGGSDQFRAGFGAQGALLGTLVTGKLKHGGFSLFADVLANEAATNPDGTDIDSNPVGLVRQGEGYILADAGGNAVVRASHRGFNTITPLPPTAIGADAVPTSVVRGPDGAYYISQLTGFPFEPGAANIWRVVPGQAPTVYASGLTNLTDLAFAADGTLYAVEISSIGLLNGPIGALVRITPGGSQHTTVVGDLFAPYGVALAGNNAYVSTCAVCTGGGEVIKISLD
ncbi:MAG TPA: ScyD/ScyE family protein [Acidimicrobiales bacterium]|nr:ScyD/ScyE family protein [Acidimicrobiales bacterium]